MHLRFRRLLLPRYAHLDVNLYNSHKHTNEFAIFTNFANRRNRRRGPDYWVGKRCCLHVASLLDLGDSRNFGDYGHELILFLAPNSANSAKSLAKRALFKTALTIPPPPPSLHINARGHLQRSPTNPPLPW